MLLAFDQLFFAAILVLFSTGAGALALVLIKCPGPKLYSTLIAFSAGMMAFSSAQMAFSAHQIAGNAVLLLGLGVGVFALFALEKLLPHIHLLLRKRKMESAKKKAALIAGTITIHNVPEGLAIASAFAGGPALGWLVASSIAVQDIPEGFLAGAPLACYGLKAKRAFTFAFFSGFVEFVAAIVGYLFLSFAASLTPLALAFSAGAMAYVVMVELLPDAFQPGLERTAALSLIGGIAIAFVIETFIHF